VPLPTDLAREQALKRGYRRDRQAAQALPRCLRLHQAFQALLPLPGYWSPFGGSRRAADLVVQQRLHSGVPERSLGLEMLSPNPDLRLQPLRLVGSPQSLQSRVPQHNRSKS
jgi:hypothetical protein